MLDIDDVHPAILAYLDIDVGKAKAAQVAADTAWLWKGVNEQREAVEMAQRAQVQQEIDERLRIEQAKANAEIAKANAQEQATREAAYNERVKAEAAARMADAAMIEASKPAASVNVIQQQQQQQ